MVTESDLRIQNTRTDKQTPSSSNFCIEPKTRGLEGYSLPEPGTSERVNPQHHPPSGQLPPSGQSPNPVVTRGTALLSPGSRSQPVPSGDVGDAAKTKSVGCLLHQRRSGEGGTEGVGRARRVSGGQAEPLDASPVTRPCHGHRSRRVSGSNRRAAGQPRLFAAACARIRLSHPPLSSGSEHAPRVGLLRDAPHRQRAPGALHTLTRRRRAARTDSMGTDTRTRGRAQGQGRAAWRVARHPAHGHGPGSAPQAGTAAFQPAAALPAAREPRAGSEHGVAAPRVSRCSRHGDTHRRAARPTGARGTVLPRRDHPDRARHTGLRLPRPGPALQALTALQHQPFPPPTIKFH